MRHARFTSPRKRKGDNMTTTNNRPFEKIATATLISVVKRGRYARYGREFELALDNELMVRKNLRVS
jgi:hypothetical protein